jgi:hypothetical protein
MHHARESHVMMLKEVRKQYVPLNRLPTIYLYLYTNGLIRMVVGSNGGLDRAQSDHT